ncbi:MAG: MarR family winged helix-turn-helix transcriptional regulator [Ktedonobacterales bacterium]
MKTRDEATISTRPERRLGVALWGRLARFYERQLRLAGAHLRAWDVSTAQFDVLATVGAHEGITQQELAERLLVTQGNVTQLLDKLEQRGLLRRCPEGRTNQLVLTDAGRRLHDDVVPAQEHFQAQQFAPLSLAERQQLLALLRKLQHAQR